MKFKYFLPSFFIFLILGLCLFTNIINAETPINTIDIDNTLSQLDNPIILFLITGVILIACIGAVAGIEIAVLSLVIYLIIGVIINIIPIWVLVVIVIIGGGLIAYKLSKGISGGGGEE